MEGIHTVAVLNHENALQIVDMLNIADVPAHAMLKFFVALILVHNIFDALIRVDILKSVTTVAKLLEFLKILKLIEFLKILKLIIVTAIVVQ